METIHDLLESYVEKIEKHLGGICLEFQQRDDLAKALVYTLQQKGKRLRPAITLMVAEAVGSRCVLDSALSLELFHTASLLADDLPCMDDAQDRRGHLTTHKAFNEATALLASYALIAKGYQLIALNGSSLSSQVLQLALQNASHNTGYFGASGGQFLDLYPTKIDAALIDEVMRKKTAALFETAFLFGWLFGGRIDQLEDVKQLGMDFGFAFQLVDDLLDYEEDLRAGRKINYAIFNGFSSTVKQVTGLLDSCKKGLEELGLATAPLLGIVQLLSSKIDLIPLRTLPEQHRELQRLSADSAV